MWTVTTLATLLQSTCSIIDLFLHKGSSFKSPALKDVKIQKSNVASFQPSQKARDWSSLEQSLESVFSVQDQQKVSNFINVWQFSARLMS